jgi:hypothetical protein
MILRPDGTFDFYSRLSEMHEQENIDLSYQYFQRQLKEKSPLQLPDGSKVFRKPIRRAD